MFDFIAENFNEFLTYTGFANATAGNLIMIVVGALVTAATVFVWRMFHRNLHNDE